MNAIICRIFITENGLSCNDHIFLDGKVHDAERIDFLTRYLLQLSESIKEGTPVMGYFHWSFTDNFEWHSGYDERFGLVYIDYPTQKLDSERFLLLVPESDCRLCRISRRFMEFHIPLLPRLMRP